MSLQEHSPNSQVSSIQNWNANIKNLNIEESKFIVFLKYSTFQNKSSQPCTLALFDSKQLLRLNKVISLIYQKHIDKQLTLTSLIGHWGLLSYLFPQRTGLFLNQIFLLMTQNQLVKYMYPQQERYQMDQTIKILLNSQWKKDQEFIKSISVLLNMPSQKQKIILQVQNSFKILGFLSQQDQFDLFVKRVIRVLSNYKIIQTKQQKFKTQFLNLIKSTSQKQQKDQTILHLKNYVISEPDSFIVDQHNQFSEEEISKNYKYDSLDQKKLMYESKFEEGQSTISFSKTNLQIYNDQGQTKCKRKIFSPQIKNISNSFSIAIKRPKKTDYNKGMRSKYKYLTQHFIQKAMPCFQKKKLQALKRNQNNEKLKKIFRKTYIDQTVEYENKLKKHYSPNAQVYVAKNNNLIFQINNNHSMIEESQQITMKRNPYQKLPLQRKKNKKQKSQHFNIKKNKNSKNKEKYQSEELLNQYSQNFQYESNSQSENHQNEQTKRFIPRKVNQQQNYYKFDHLKQKNIEKNKMNKKIKEINLRENTYYQNIQDMEIKKYNIKQGIVANIIFDSKAYLNYLGCLCSQKEIKKQVLQIVRQYLTIDQSKIIIKQLKCFRKVLVAYIFSVSDNGKYLNIWKHYGQQYLIPIIKKRIFQHMSVLVAGQINILFSSQENQNVQLLNQHLSDINFIFQESRIVSIAKVRNEIILNITKWIYSQCIEVFKTVSQNQNQILNEVSTKINFQINEEPFLKQLKISLKPIDKFTTIMISLLLLDQHLFEIFTRRIQGQINLIYKQKNLFWLKQVSDLLKKKISNQTNKKTVLNILVLLNKCFEVTVIKNKSKQETFKFKCKIVYHFIDYFKIISQQHVAVTNKQFKDTKDKIYNQLIKCLNSIIIEFIQGEKHKLNALNIINIVTKQTQLKEFFEPTFAKIDNGSNLDSNKWIQINLAFGIQILKTFLKFQIFRKIQDTSQKTYFLKNILKIKDYVKNNQKANYDTSFLIGLWQLFLELYKVRISINIWYINDIFIKENSQYQKNSQSNVELWNHIEQLYFLVQKKFIKFYNMQDNISDEEGQKTKKYSKIIKYYVSTIFQLSQIRSNFNDSISQRKLSQKDESSDLLANSIPHYYNSLRILVKTRFFNDYFKLRKMLNQKQNQQNYLKQDQDFCKNIIIKTVQRLQYLNQILFVQKQIKLNENYYQNQEQKQDQRMMIALQRKKQNSKIMEIFLAIVSQNQICFQLKSQNIRYKYQLQGQIHSIIYLSKSYNSNYSLQNKQQNDLNKATILCNLKKYQVLNFTRFYQKIDNYKQVSCAQIYFTGMSMFINKFLIMLSNDQTSKIKAEKCVRKQLFSSKNLNLFGSIMIVEIFLNKSESILEVKNIFIRMYELLLKQGQASIKQWNLMSILYKIFLQTKQKPFLNCEEFLLSLHRLSSFEIQQGNKNLSEFSRVSVQILQALLIIIKQAIYNCENAQIKSKLIRNLINSFNTILIWPQLLPSTIKKYLSQILPNSQQQILIFLSLNFENIKLISENLKALQRLSQNVFHIKQALPKIIVNSILKQIVLKKNKAIEKQNINNFQNQQKDSIVNMFYQFIQIFDYLEKICQQTNYQSLQAIRKFTTLLCCQFLKPLGSQSYFLKKQNCFDKKQQSNWLSKYTINNKYQILFTYFVIIKDSVLLRKQIQNVFNQNINEIQQIIKCLNFQKGIQYLSTNILKEYDTIQSIIKKYLIGKHSDFYLLKEIVNSRIQKIKFERENQLQKKALTQIQQILEKIIKIAPQSLQCKNKEKFFGKINQDLYSWFIQKQNQIKSFSQNQRMSVNEINNTLLKEKYNNLRDKTYKNQSNNIVNKSLNNSISQKMQLQS